MKKVAILPNLITAIGLSFGLFVIFKTNLPLHDESEFKLLHAAALLLVGTALADFIDGAIARLVKGESEFGILFDSLADAISFGVAPSVLFLKTVGPPLGTPLSFLCVASAMIYTLCGILRLVRFTVSSNPYRNELVDDHVQKKNFTGLPIPAGASVIVAVNLLFFSPLFRSMFPFSKMTISLVLSALLVTIGLLMVSKIKFPSLKTLHIRIRAVPLMILSVVSALFLLYGILYFLPFLFVTLAVGYVLIGLTLSCIRYIAGKKTSMLEDYDLEE